MDLIQLKIKKDASVIKYIKLIREFDSSLSMGDLKRRIESDDFVIGFDTEEYDVLDELNDIDRKESFRNMIGALVEAGAEVSAYQNGELLSLEQLDNWFGTLDETDRQTGLDMERESNRS